MKCPICGNEKTCVKDSRLLPDGVTVRRRRVCVDQNGVAIHAFTTYERAADTCRGHKGGVGYVLGGKGAQNYSREDVWARIFACCTPDGCTMLEANDILLTAEKYLSEDDEEFTIPQADLVILQAILKHKKYSYFVSYAAARFYLTSTDDLNYLQKLTSLKLPEIHKLQNTDFPCPCSDIVMSPFDHPDKIYKESRILEDKNLPKENL